MLPLKPHPLTSAGVAGFATAKHSPAGRAHCLQCISAHLRELATRNRNKMIEPKANPMIEKNAEHYNMLEPMTDARNTQLEKLLQQKTQLEERIKDAKAKIRTQERKQDTRRKIIIGAIAENHAEMYPESEFAQELQRLLNRHVLKPRDRELVGLPAISAADNFTKEAGK